MIKFTRTQINKNAQLHDKEFIVYDDVKEALMVLVNAAVEAGADEVKLKSVLMCIFTGDDTRGFISTIDKSIVEELTEKVKCSMSSSFYKFMKENCEGGGEHINTIGNACGGDYGICSKCNKSIKHVDNKWVTNER